MKETDLQLATWSVVNILQGKCNDTPVPGQWRGHLHELVLYGLEMCHVARFEHELTNNDWKIIGAYKDLVPPNHERIVWLGNPWLHRSHRSYLIGRNPGHYYELFPGNPLKMPMLWPQLDDTDERGYKLYITKKHKALVESGAYRLPTALQLNPKTLEVTER